MKTQIHPKWYKEAKASCACGNVFTLGATVPEITVEICSNCHPFYTGEMKFVGVAGRVENFNKKRSGAQVRTLSKTQKRALKKEKKIKEELERPESLSELRNG